MNSSSKYGAETGIHNDLAARRGKNVLNCYVPLCPVSGLLKGIVAPSGSAKTDFPVAGRKRRRP